MQSGSGPYPRLVSFKEPRSGEMFIARDLWYERRARLWAKLSFRSSGAGGHQIRMTSINISPLRGFALI